MSLLQLSVLAEEQSEITSLRSRREANFPSSPANEGVTECNLKPEVYTKQNYMMNWLQTVLCHFAS